MLRLILCLAALTMLNAAEDPVVTVRKRLVECAAANPSAADPLQAWVQSLGADGRWPDIDYRTQRRASWPAAEHWKRLRSLAVAARQVEAGQRPALIATITRAIDGWQHDRPISDNWFSNEIGVPQQAADILLLMGKDLDAQHGATLRQFIGQPLAEGRTSTFTGQNLVWRAGIALTMAAVDGDRSGVERAVQRIASVLAVTTDEGIQPDGSYHQHGPQLYALGYGSSLVADAAELTQVLSGTPWAIPAEASDAIAGLVLDGQRWLLRGGYWDPSAGSRSISRATKTEASNLSAPLRLLAAAGLARRDELAALAGWLAKPVGAPVEGVRTFWRSDLSVGQFPAWSVAIKTSSRRTRRSESINDENLRGGHLCDGVTWLRPQGGEYATIIPLLDWLALPGLTAAEVEHPPRVGFGVPGSATWAGGVSDGRRGLHAFQQRQDGLGATRCWFILPEGLVALGSGIGHAKLPVRTAIDQCLRRGEVRISTAGGRERTAAEGSTPITGPATVRHAGLVYRIPAGTTATLLLETRTGSWRDINAAQSDTPVSAPIFQLTIGHGRCTAADLAYEVVPAAGAARPLATILANRVELTAVRAADGTVLAAFRTAGRLAIGSDELAVDRAALLILDPATDRLTFSDPTWETAAGPPAMITVTWRGRARQVALPQGRLTGSSTSMLLR